MWLGIKAAAVCVSLVVLFRIFSSVRDTPTRFVLTAVWLRYVLAAFHDFTYGPVVAGFSINALASIGVVGVGLLLVRKSALLMQHLWPAYLLVGAILLSGVINASPIDLVDVLTKWGYFIVIGLCAYDAVRIHGLPQFAKILAAAFIVPLGMQYLSFALGAAKALESDGSVSYIGMYNHESIFSITLLTFVFLASLPGAWRRNTQWLLVGMGAFALYLTNYRTSYFALLPILAYFVLRSVTGSVVAPQRALVGALTAVSVAIGIGAIAIALQDRLIDVVIVAQNAPDYLKPPYDFTDPERDLFSSRVYIWSQYVYEYLSGDFLTYLVGYGPNGWEGKFHLYAHNTFVGYIHDFGAIGLACLLLLLATNAILSLRAPEVELRFALLSAHVGFVFLNMATMPLWQIEGEIFYGLLCGVTWAAALNRAPMSRGVYRAEGGYAAAYGR